MINLCQNEESYFIKFIKMKKILKKILFFFGYEVKHVFNSRDSLYRPLYSPWFGESVFLSHYKKCAAKTLVSQDRCYILFKTLQQSLSKEGDVMECGVYKGGTALLIANCMFAAKSLKKLYLFDTFEGMPETDSKKDWHKKGDFSDTSLETVREYIGFQEIVKIRKGLLPLTFQGLEDSKFCFAHIDLDIYRSIWDTLDFVWPRLVAGGCVIFDDYGFPSCPGAREAVDEFFAKQDSVPLCIPTGQALVFKA
jgi:O-methyltransferase